ncbi:diguanylate cyclase [Bradyrhizobium sp. U531]|uniref:GGDEF domain-containing protein n=1 Tax=Bradyrhizobium sp. U531 TaxID=3053458 RepID=UPI003F434018
MTDVALASLEAFMSERRRRSIRFPHAIERQFEADTHAKRCKRLTIGLLVSVPLYNFFLLGDWLLVPDVIRLATWIHFAVVTPWMLLAAWIVSRSPDPFVRECIAASVPLLIILQIDLGFSVTTSASAAHYQYVVIPTLLYTNVSIHRLEFRFARAVSGAILVLHTALVLWASYISTAVAATIIVQILICAYITLVANYTMERDLRRAYLFSLRDRLRHAEADAASRRDPLTGLANRLRLEGELAKLWSLTELKASVVSVVMIDIDHFKRLNDRYGHGAGDLCLKRVAALLLAELDEIGDLAVRYGGEEFLLLLPGLDLVDAIRLAERIRRSIESAAIPNEGSGMRGVVTASFGIAASSTSDLSPVELIAAADQALYAAKSKGRNQVWPPPTTSLAAIPSNVIAFSQGAAVSFESKVDIK